jgi:hypothetical protein
MEKNQELERQWKERLLEQETSGLTHQEWCASQSIPLSTLRYWRGRLRNTQRANAPEKAAFVQVNVEDQARQSDVPELEMNCVRFQRITVEFPAAYDYGKAQDILKVVSLL